MVAVWFMAGGRDANFAYNFFGQVALVKALLLFSGYYWSGLRKAITIGRQLLLMLVCVVPSAGLALLVGRLWQRFGLLSFMAFAGSAEEFYDPSRIVSLMPVFHIVAWLLLILTTPLWSLKLRLAWVLTGDICSSISFLLLWSVLFYVRASSALLVDKIY